MTTNYDELHWHAPFIMNSLNWLNWLYSDNIPLGHVYKVKAHRHFKDEALHGTYAVSVWLPREELIARLPADLPINEALDAAKVLIVLRLKEMGML
jgi:hypothetical protein